MTQTSNSSKFSPQIEQSSFTHFLGLDLTQAIYSVMNDIKRVEQVQILADEANASLRTSSHHLSRLIRSMLTVFGRDNTASMWNVPADIRDVFMNFLLDATLNDELA